MNIPFGKKNESVDISPLPAVLIANTSTFISVQGLVSLDPL